MLKFIMSTAFLYVACVLIWGSTWITIEYQLGYVAHEYSSFYRFGLASLFLFAYCGLKKLPLRYSYKQHLWLFLMGASLFSINYILIYEAQEHLTSAMASVIFSSILVINIINSRICFKTPIGKEIMLGSVLGLIGIVLIFWHDLQDFSLESKTVYGLSIALLGVFIASIGNMVSVQTQQFHIPVIQMNTWAMLYGALFSFGVGLAKGEPMTYDATPSYTVSLLYLALFGSVIAFGAYLTLLRRIGVQKTSYSVVLFPAVALVISTILEGFVWTPTIAAGIVLIALGNVIVVSVRKPAPETTN